MNNKLRGNSWERDCAKLLSKIISDGAYSKILWRSASSGALATISGYDTQRGDLVSIDPAYHFDFVIECKYLKINSIVPMPAVLQKIVEDLYNKYQLNWLLCLKINGKGKFLISPKSDIPFVKKTKMLALYYFYIKSFFICLIVTDMNETLTNRG